MSKGRSSRVARWSANPGTPGSGGGGGTADFVGGSDAPGASAALANLIPAGSWLNTILPANTATAPTSAAAVAEIRRQIAAFTPWINTHSWTATVNLVGPLQPLVPVTMVGWRAAESWAGNVKKMMLAGLPLPANLEPTNDSDATIILIQPGWNRTTAKYSYEQRVYELWAATPPHRSTTGGWTAQWAGRMAGTNRHRHGHWINWYWQEDSNVLADQWTSGDGVGEEASWGAMATSVLMSHTLIRRDDMIRGHTDHPIGIMGAPLPVAQQGSFVWPAMRNDSASQKDWRQGSRLRLPAGYPVPETLPRLDYVIRRAVRDYGFVFIDTASGIVLRAEPGAQLHFEGRDVTACMRAFPWQDLVQIAVGSDSIYTPLS